MPTIPLPRANAGLLLILAALSAAAGIWWALIRPSQQAAAAPVPSHRLQMLQLSLRTRANVVFVGDSLTELADWSDIMGCSSLANRGIGSQTSAKALERIDETLRLKPRAVFIMLGVNDVALNIPTAETVANIDSIRARIKESGADVFVISTLPVSARESRRIPRAAIASINAQTKPEFNLKALLTAEGDLRDELTTDGVHLNASAYSEWRDTLLPTVQKYCADTEG